MALRWMGTLVPPFRLLDCGPSHESVESNCKEDKKAHPATVISSKPAMVGCIDVVR